MALKIINIMNIIVDFVVIGIKKGSISVQYSFI